MDSSRRIASILAAAAMVAVVLLAPRPALAAPGSAEIAAQIKALNDQVAKAGVAYEKAEFALDDTELQIRQNARRSAVTAKALKAARGTLRGRAADIYRVGQTDMLALLFEADSMDDFLTRMSYLEAIAGQDAAMVSQVKNLSASIAKQRAAMMASRRRQRAIVAGRAERVRRLQAGLASRQAEYARLRAQMLAAAARERAAGSSAPVSVGKGANGMVFPVAGPNFYSDTWGAARSGGRTHKGTDIMANTGVPVVAVVDGSVSSKEGGLGGKVIWLHGSGWSFYYAHLDGWKVRSGPVKAGQVIGWVGATGNAAGGASHLHFQMHPGGGSPVNPYPYLRGMQ